MDKLQELTERLYQEGLSKGKEEGEALLGKARAEAASIVENARLEADAILAKARKDAADHKSHVENDLRMASQQALQATRKDIENLVVTRITAEPTASALSSDDFIRQIIVAVAQKFSSEEPQDLALILPEKLKAQLEPFVSGELGKLLGKGVQASFTKKIAGGFKIGPKDGSYFIDLSDEAFQELISAYLRPATRALLFG